MKKDDPVRQSLFWPAEIDPVAKEVHVVLQPGWTVTIMPSNSGALLKETGAKNDGLFRALVCEQVGPAPTIVEMSKDAK